MILSGTLHGRQQQLESVLFEVRTTDPSGPVAGQFWWRSDLNRPRYWDGSAVQTLVTESRLQASSWTLAGTIVLSNSPVFSIATGTSPFTVTSTTLVANLNADMLDGFDSAVAVTNSTVAVRNASGQLSAADPTSNANLVTLGYFNSVLAGRVNPKVASQAATTANLSATRTSNVLTATGNGAFPAQDGVTLTINQVLLVKNQTAPEDNGLYSITTVGNGSTPYALTRTVDADSSPEVVNGIFTLVLGGTQAGTWALTTPDPITLNTTGLTWVQTSAGFSGVAGHGIDISGNTISVLIGGSTTYTQYGIVYASTTAAISQLGLGTTSQVLHGNASGAPTWGSIVNADIAAATINLTTKVTGVLPIANGGTNNASPGVTLGGIYYADGSKFVLAAGTTNQFVCWNTSGAPIDFNLFGTPNTWSATQYIPLSQAFNFYSSGADRIGIGAASGTLQLYTGAGLHIALGKMVTSTFTAEIDYQAGIVLDILLPVFINGGGWLEIDMGATDHEPLQLVPQTTPTSPQNGAIWAETGGLFGHIGGVTFQIGSTSSSGVYVGASATTGKIAKWGSSTTLTDSIMTESSSLITIAGRVIANPTANNQVVFSSTRFTDTSPTGDFIQFKSAAAADLFRVGITGAVTVGSWTASVVAMQYGGTGANLTAANGGIMWSNASTLAITAAGTSGQVLVSGGAATPVWTNLSGIGVTSITGTANQVIASASTGAVTLSLPQSIATTSTVQFGTIGVGTGSPDGLVTIQAASGNNLLSFKNSSGTSKAYLGIPNATDGIITGTVSGDLALRSNGGSILLSTDSGASAQLKLDSAGGSVFSGSVTATKITLTQGTITSGILGIDASVTWNSGGTTFGVWKLNVTDTASGSGSLLVDLGVGGTTLVKIAKSGIISSTGVNPMADLTYNLGGGSFRWAQIRGGEMSLTGNTHIANTSFLFDTAVTWNASGVIMTAWRFNLTDTASTNSSLFLDFQVSSTSKLQIGKDGTLGVGTARQGNAWISVAANTTARGGIAFVLTSAAVLTTRAAGMLEFDSSGILYWTQNTTFGTVSDRCRITTTYAQNITTGGDGIGTIGATSTTITHNRGTKDIQVAMYALNTSYGNTVGDRVDCDVRVSTTNAIIINYASGSLVSGDYRIVVTG